MGVPRSRRRATVALRLRRRLFSITRSVREGKREPDAGAEPPLCLPRLETVDFLDAYSYAYTYSYTYSALPPLCARKTVYAYVYRFAVYVYGNTLVS